MRNNKNNWLEKSIEFVSPEWKLKRDYARAMLTYAGASTSGIRGNWAASDGSADAVNWWDYATMRNRSRELSRDNSLVVGAVDTFVDNIVGEGVKPQSRPDAEALGWTETQVNEFQHAAERAWEIWTRYADVSGKLDFTGLMELYLRQIIDNGDHILTRHYMNLTPRLYNERPYGLAFDSIEADRLDTPTAYSSDKSVRCGVRTNKWGMPTVYYIKRTHPGDYIIGEYNYDDYKPVTAVDVDGRPNVIHGYKIKRSGQTRGIPLFAPALTKFKDLDSYFEAELIAARVSACFAVFLKRKGGTSPIDAKLGTDRKLALEPGAILDIDEDQTPEFANPTRPNANAIGFSEHLERMIGAGIGLPYEMLMKMYAGMNYSNAKVMLTETRRTFNNWRKFLMKSFALPAWKLLLEEAWLKGELPHVKNFYTEWEHIGRAKWLWARYGWIDPGKEMSAYKMGLESGILSYGDIGVEQGADPEDQADQQSREIKYRQSRNLIVLGSAQEPAKEASYGTN